jgi:hypothetical protein
MERVVTVRQNGQDVASPVFQPRQEFVNDTVGGKASVVVWKSGTVSALDKGEIANSRDIGATAVYDATLDGRTLTCPHRERNPEPGAAVFHDAETGSDWTLTGKAVRGPMAGKQLDADHSRR